MYLKKKLTTITIGLALIIFLLMAQSRGVKAATTVTNLNDSGAGSLRQAIADAAPGDTITFAVSGTIILTSGELLVAKDLTLSGPGAASLSISGNLLSRVINNSAHLTISGLTIRNGESGAGTGGGILNAGTGVLTINNSLITANRAQRGAGVFNSPGGTLQVTNSTFSANFTRLVDVGFDASGAGIYNGGVANITGSTFSSNDVHDHGSGLYNAATATVANSTFSLGQANNAAVYNDKNGSLQLNNVTITLNSGRKDATGLLSAGGSVSLANSIIAENHTVGGGNNTSLPDCGGTLTSGGHNLVGNATGCSISAGTGDLLGSDLAPLNPKLGPLTNNGGPTQTHTLLAGSPAIDAGSPAAPGSGGSACEAADQRGFARPALGASSLTCDIGAVELGAASLLASNSSPTVLGQATTFTASGLTAGFQYQWNFGDGAMSSTNPTSHTYGAAGFYTAVVTATNMVITLTASTHATITNLAPIANAGPNQSVSLNALVTLDGSGSSDPDGHTPLSYGWEQAGGLNVVLSSPTISMPTFTAPAASGILTFTLTVTDARGLAGAPAQTLVFAGDVPISSLIATNSSPTLLGQATTLTATAIGSNVAYQWNFGDGASGTGGVMTHTYGAVGAYLAVVTATNTLNTLTATTTVSVIPVHRLYLPLIMRGN